MKLILMTAALAMGAPAMLHAQSMTKPVPAKGVPTAKPHHPMKQTMPKNKANMDRNSSADMDDGAMDNGAMNDNSQTMGGMEPSQPALSAPPQPGQQVEYHQAPSVNEAYPAPQPMASYPICKSGQTDGCRQRGPN